MNYINTFDLDSMRKIAADHERLMYMVERQQSRLRAFANELDDQEHVYLAEVGSNGITARSSLTPGSGTVELYTFPSGGVLVASGTQVTCYNIDDWPINADEFILIAKDQYGNYWAVPPPLDIKKPKCKFTLDATLTTGDAYAAATIEEQYGFGASHNAATTIRVYNLPTSTGGVYEFYGDAGDYGIASYAADTDNPTYWHIDILECP